MKRSLALVVLALSIGGLLAVQAAPSGKARWYKGNTHTHSFWSDGNDFPEMIASWYRQRGYHFLGLSDHNILQDDPQNWKTVAALEKKGPGAIAKYEATFGEQWVEKKGEDKQASIRLKMLSEYRGKFEKAGEFLMINSEEVTDKAGPLPVHINAINVQSLIKPNGGESVQEVMAANLASIEAQEMQTGRPILAHLNHPNFRWGVTAEDMAAVTLERFWEVFNGHPGTGYLGDDDHAGNERLWDIVNTLRMVQYHTPPLYGVGTDDSHSYHKDDPKASNPGRGWVMVRAADLNPAAIITAMRAGDFYASSGVTLSDVSFDEKTRTITIQVEKESGVEYGVEWIGSMEGVNVTGKPKLNSEGKELAVTREYSPEIGKVLATGKGDKFTYTLTGKELYVRAVVTSTKDPANPIYDGQKCKAWIQPMGWKGKK